MAETNPNRGVLVTLIPIERRLIREALQELPGRLSPAEQEILESLLRRIPDPKDD